MPGSTRITSFAATSQPPGCGRDTANATQLSTLGLRQLHMRDGGP